MEKKVKATVVFEKIAKALEDSRIRNVVLQGGSRSSKTYSIAQYIILKCISDWAGKKKVITIARKSFPALRASVMRDFFEILQSLELYSEEAHNKTTHEYELMGNLIEFISVDQEAKVRGRKRNILWCNEATEFDWDSFFQLNIRTTELVFLDYNPSEEYHWIYEQIIPREDTAFIKSTYRDNPFLPEALRQEIEGLKEVDENLWLVYGLGEVGKARDLILTNWSECRRMPHVCEHYRYGLDFGYNDPTALVFVGVVGDDVYVEEIIYERGLTNQDLIEKMKALGVSKKILIRADSAEPDRIKELSLAGFTVEGVEKYKRHKIERIDSLKRRKLHITRDSSNIIKEIKNWRWKKDKATGEILDEPVDFMDHAMDALLYAVGDLLRDRYLFEKQKYDWIDGYGADKPRKAKLAISVG